MNQNVAFKSTTYLHSADKSNLLYKEMSRFELFHIDKASFQMVCSNDEHHFDLSSETLQKPDIVDLELRYGDAFLSVHLLLLEALQEAKSSRITVLHGPPETGETRYLRHLINKIEDKELSYV